MAKFRFEDAAQLFLALSGGSLSGFQPQGKVDASKLNFPVEIEASLEKKTFKIASQGQTSTTKGKFWETPLLVAVGAVAAVAVAVLVGVAIYHLVR